jgi:hypothetical protein
MPRHYRSPFASRILDLGQAEPESVVPGQALIHPRFIWPNERGQVRLNTDPHPEVRALPSDEPSPNWRLPAERLVSKILREVVLPSPASGRKRSATPTICR